MFQFLGIYLRTKEWFFLRRRKFIHFFIHKLSILAYNFKSRALINKMIKLQHKIYIIKVMNSLILTQIEHSVLKSVFFLLSKGHNLVIFFHLPLVKMQNV